jgi:hypothetical protein
MYIKELLEKNALRHTVIYAPFVTLLCSSRESAYVKTRAGLTVIKRSALLVI